MKRAQKFTVPRSWQIMLTAMKIDVQKVLTYANLPADLFNRNNAYLTPAEYFRFWEGIESAAHDKDVPLLIAENFSAEVFDAPIFAALCSENFNMAVKRLSHYKPLIGPMELQVDVDDKQTSLKINCYGNEQALPRTLSMAESVFFTQLIRHATHEQVIPLSIQTPQMPIERIKYQDYFGCTLEQGEELVITFSAEDAAKPFFTFNSQMWEFFEDKLNQRLADLDNDATTVDRVRAVLIEALPSGEVSMEHVASKLAMSKRTLQRKLTAEADTFQSVLMQVRSELADHYLEKSDMSLGEISFLLGFQEANSFIRAYSSWKGISPGSYRDQIQ